MRNLIDFLLKYSSAFLFAFLFLLSLIFLFSNGRYHSSVWFTSANVFSNKIYGISHGVSDYFNLKEINQSLQESNARLENEVLNLRSELGYFQAIVQDSIDHSDTRRFNYILASVVNNSTRHPRNYFTIDRGEKDGVKPGMGVVDQNGIVGVVNVAGKNTSRIISLLNVTQHLSVRIEGTSIVGSLNWKVNDPKIAYMEEVPRHSVFKIGDKVVTSGYSTAFPADIPVGTIIAKIRAANDNFYTLKIRLASDFNTLSTVRVLKDEYKEELDSLKNFDLASD